MPWKNRTVDGSWETPPIVQILLARTVCMSREDSIYMQTPGSVYRYNSRLIAKRILEMILLIE